MKQGTISFLIGGLYSILITAATALIIYVIPLGIVRDDIDRHGLKGSTEQSLHGIILAGVMVLLSFAVQIILINKLKTVNKDRSNGAATIFIITMLLLFGAITRH